MSEAITPAGSWAVIGLDELELGRRVATAQHLEDADPLRAIGLRCWDSARMRPAPPSARAWLRTGSGHRKAEAAVTAQLEDSRD